METLNQNEPAIVPGEFTTPFIAMVGPHGIGNDVDIEDASDELLAQLDQSLDEDFGRARLQYNDAKRVVRHETLRRMNVAEKTRSSKINSALVALALSTVIASGCGTPLPTHPSPTATPTLTPTPHRTAP